MKDELKKIKKETNAYYPGICIKGLRKTTDVLSREGLRKRNNSNNNKYLETKYKRCIKRVWKREFANNKRQNRCYGSKESKKKEHT
jgi:gamma-glutamylcysteine synthetase